MYAKVKRVVQHIEDIIHSVTRSPDLLDEVAGEYADAIREHKAEILGIVIAFLTAEAASALLAASPTGVGQIAAALIQLVLAAFGAAGMVQAIASALDHAAKWLNLAWTAKGSDQQVAQGSREFLRMLVSIAMAALAWLGVKGNFASAVRIGNSINRGGNLAFAAVRGSGDAGSAAAAAGPRIPLRPGSAMAMAGNREGNRGNREKEYQDEDFDPGPRKNRISDGNKVELEDSGWLKKKLSDPDRRREFMKWLEKNHKQGEAHEHLKPGSREAQRMLDRFLAENP